MFAPAAGVRIRRRVMVPPNTIRPGDVAFAAALGPVGVHAPIVILNDKRAWQIVSVHKPYRLIKVPFVLGAVTEEAPDMGRPGGAPALRRRQKAILPLYLKRHASG